MRVRLNFVLAGLVGLAPLVTARAWAASKSVEEANPAEKKEAGTLYQNALADFDKGVFEKALTGFRDSYGHVRSPNSHFMIARTLAKLGRNSEAYAELTSVIAEADGLGGHYAETATSARQKQEEIRPRVGLLTVHVSHAPKGTVVKVAGETIDDTKLASPIPVLPGETPVGVTKPGAVELAYRKTVQAGESATFEIDLAADATPVKREMASHPRYLLELEAHVVGETLDPPGPPTRGAGPGAHVAWEFAHTGFLGSADSFALGAGFDWIATSYLHHVWVPVSAQWNVWALENLSLMVEPGVAVMLGAGTKVSPALDVGARYRVWRKVSVVGRLGIPGASLGVSVML